MCQFCNYCLQGKRTRLISEDSDQFGFGDLVDEAPAAEEEAPAANEDVAEDKPEEKATTAVWLQWYEHTN